MIVSNNLNNEHSQVVEAVYCTTREKTPLPTHVKINSTTQESTVLCEQIFSIDKSRLRGCAGHCNEKEMKEIDEALVVSLGLKTSETVVVTDQKNIALETERNIYKTLYEQLLERVLDGKVKIKKGKVK